MAFFTEARLGPFALRGSPGWKKPGERLRVTDQRKRH